MKANPSILSQYLRIHQITNGSIDNSTDGLHEDTVQENTLHENSGPSHGHSQHARSQEKADAQLQPR